MCTFFDALKESWLETPLMPEDVPILKYFIGSYGRWGSPDDFADCTCENPVFE